MMGETVMDNIVLPGFDPKLSSAIKTNPSINNSNANMNDLLISQLLNSDFFIMFNFKRINSKKIYFYASNILSVHLKN